MICIFYRKFSEGRCHYSARRSVCSLACNFGVFDVVQVPPVEGISNGLGEEFKLVHVEQVPSMRPLSDRVFEYASAQATVWRRD